MSGEEAVKDIEDDGRREEVTPGEPGTEQGRESWNSYHHRGFRSRDVLVEKHDSATAPPSIVYSLVDADDVPGLHPLLPAPTAHRAPAEITRR